MPSEYETKFMVDMCGRRDTEKKQGEMLRVYQLTLVAVQMFPRVLRKKSVRPSQSKPPVAATGITES